VVIPLHFNQLTSIQSSDGSSTTFGYGGNGNQITKTVTPVGGTPQLTQYVYNQDNRLVGIPPGPGYEWFDQASVKLYDEDLN
jgi:YD repeat-containing protein